MAAAVKLLLTILLLCIFATGESQRCDSADIYVVTVNTGVKYNAMDFIFEVHVTNACRCPVSNVHLRSNGFSSSLPVSPKAFRVDGYDSYLVNDGKAIANKATFRFQYANDRGFQMVPTENFTINCW